MIAPHSNAEITWMLGLRQSTRDWIEQNYPIMASKLSGTLTGEYEVVEDLGMVGGVHMRRIKRWVSVR